MVSKNRYIIFDLAFGVLVAYVLNTQTPLFPLMMLFLLAFSAVFFLFIFFKFSPTDLRIILVGASAVSIISATITFSSIVSLGMIQISLDQIAGIFRSLLLISFFSLLERLTKLIEDRRSKNEKQESLVHLFKHRGKFL